LEEDVKKLADLKARLQRRLEELQIQVDEVQSVLRIVDETLAEKSFKRVEPTEFTEAPSLKPTEPTVPPPEAQPPTKPLEYRQVFPLKGADGSLLATMYISEDEVRISPSGELKFHASTPPFQPFFINRVLEPMGRRDLDAVNMGEIQPEKAFTYEVIKEGDEIREIVIRNYRDERRLREIRTSARWTFEKMFEKLRT